MPGPLRILYVDDDRDVRRIATLSLRLDNDLSVIDVESAREALALIDAEPDAFDLFVFDVMMPETAGTELMRIIASRTDAAAAVPVVLMTARAQATDIEAYMAAGARGVIVKPFDPLRLAADLRTIMAGV
ncbi:response regulator [Sphingomonas baiyangensis]|uniref:Response regulator n=1 Tax=Sphingomonas baiyangensis TaxID=2572576 RepID=A0A4U1LA72_9SPHN|nr:response regulator [Sphingomonas baiyangensis]TKD53320.1 response regulator [Sphingomonas baiyangensis]